MDARDTSHNVHQQIVYNNSKNLGHPMAAFGCPELIHKTKWTKSHLQSTNDKEYKKITVLLCTQFENYMLF